MSEDTTELPRWNSGEPITSDRLNAMQRGIRAVHTGESLDWFIGPDGTLVIRGSRPRPFSSTSSVLAKVTGFSGLGSGIYNGRILQGALEIDPTQHFELPGSMTVPDTDDCIICNMLEVGITSTTIHSLLINSFVDGWISPGLSTTGKIQVITWAARPL